MNMTDILAERIAQKNNPTVVGLDPRIEYLPPELLRGAIDGAGKAQALYEFNCAVIDAVKDIVPAVKIQSAFYERYGYGGVRAMEDTARYAKAAGLITMADVKRNDIGSTAEAYAEAYFDGDLYDYITVNPYAGYDGIKPFVDMCAARGKGIFVLARMSNPSAADIQNLVVEDGKPLYMHVGELIRDWGKSTVGERGYSAVGAVVGATNPTEARMLRRALGSVFFLVPGYGAQGGNAAGAAAAFDENGGGAIVNNSRGIIAAYLSEKYRGMKFYAAARESAAAMAADLRAALDR